MAAISSDGSTVPPRYATVACSLARLTWAVSTPGTVSTARSTRPTQLAQVMPSTVNRTVWGETA